MSDDRPFTLAAKRVGALLLGGVLLLLWGCAAAPPPSLAPPSVSLGPVLNVLDFETGTDRVRLVPDSTGRIHALVAASRMERVYHVTVSGNAVSGPEIVRSDVSPERIDGASDRDGTLHVLMDSDHLVLQQGAWASSDPAPWADTGIVPSWAGFVPGAPELVWAFEVDGADLGASMRMDIYGFGGYGAGIIWPWFTRGSRLVLASQAHPDCWNVIGLPGRLDSWPIAFAAGPHGDVHISYFTSLGGMLEAPDPHYARLRIGELAPDPAKDPVARQLRIGNRTLRLQNVMGQRLPSPAAGAGSSSGTIAVDPESGTVLLGMVLLLRGNMYTDAPGASLAGSTGFRAHTAPAGRDAFHALQNGSYRLLTGHEWSAPLELGTPATASFWGTPWDAVDLAGTGDGKAFAVWPVPGGIVGRWIAWDASNATDATPLDTPMWPLQDPNRPEPFEPVHIVIAPPERDQGLERLAKVIVTDYRKETEFRRTTVFDTFMSSIALHPPVSELVGHIVEDRADRVLAGLGGTAPESIECDITAFEIATPANILSWNVETRLEWTLRVRGRVGTVSASASERTFLWPSEGIIGKVLHEALRQAGEEAERQLRILLAP